jgi:NhaP-type Na+/H+ or K+/H+ antiporter
MQELVPGFGRSPMIEMRPAVPEFIARLMWRLQGCVAVAEAMLNDASGLLCLRLAIATALTGVFSITEAVKTFAWLAIGGQAIGIAVSWCAGRAKRWISKRFGNDQGSFILICLL